MTYVHVVCVGSGQTEPVARAIQDLGACEVVVLGPPGEQRLVADLVEPFGLACQGEPVGSGGIAALLEAVRRVVPSDVEQAQAYIVNLTPASRSQALGLRLASLATGAQAIRVGPEGVKRLARLWLDVERPVGQAQERVLQALAALGGDGVGLSELAREARQPRDEVGYLIRGGQQARGLEAQGLVTVARAEGRPRLSLTEVGALLARHRSSLEEPRARPVTAGSTSD